MKYQNYLKYFSHFRVLSNFCEAIQDLFFAKLYIAYYTNHASVIWPQMQPYGLIKMSYSHQI